MNHLTRIIPTLTGTSKSNGLTAYELVRLTAVAADHPTGRRQRIGESATNGNLVTGQSDPRCRISSSRH
jgi:hypothetical protein